MSEIPMGRMHFVSRVISQRFIESSNFPTGSRVIDPTSEKTKKERLSVVHLPASRVNEETRKEKRGTGERVTRDREEEREKERNKK